MTKYLFFILIPLMSASCKFVPADNSKGESYLKEGPSYKISLNPASGSKYRYKVSSKTVTDMEVNEKKIYNENNSDIDIIYTVGRDKADDVIMSMKYEKITLFQKNGETETELDADNGSFSPNPAEKLLGAIKSSKIDVYLRRNGTVKSVNGYKELADSIFSKIQFTDAVTASMAREQWDKTIESSLIRQNVDQFFRIFPDSTVHLREKWRIVNDQQGEFRLKTITTFFVKALTDKEIFIESYADVSSDTTAAKANYSESRATLQGNQTGEYIMEVSTGMLLSAKINSSLNGTVIVRNVEVPLKIKTKVTMTGGKIK